MNIASLDKSVVEGVGIQFTFDSTVREPYPIYATVEPEGRWRLYVKRLDPGDGYVFDGIMAGVHRTAFGWRHERIVQEFQVSFREIGSMFKELDRVLYVPTHAEGDQDHPDCEKGRVSTVTEKMVFVRFDKDVKLLGWADAQAKACYPESLVKIPNEPQEMP